MNKTLYKRLEDLCARENVIAKLSDNTFRTFVDLLYDDIGMTVFEKLEQLHKYTYVDRFNICDECYNKEEDDE